MIHLNKPILNRMHDELKFSTSPARSLCFINGVCACVFVQITVTTAMCGCTMIEFLEYPGWWQTLPHPYAGHWDYVGRVHANFNLIK